MTILVDPTTKDGYGYNTQEYAAYTAGSSTPLFDVDPASGARVVASFPVVGPVLASGHLSDEAPFLGKAVIVEAPLGAGNIYMVSPNVVYRALLVVVHVPLERGLRRRQIELLIAALVA